MFLRSISRIFQHLPPTRVLQVAAYAAAITLALASVPNGASASVLPTDRVDGVPNSRTAAYGGRAPDIDAAAGILVADDGRQLWERKADERRAMASTTKIMTAVVVLERARLNETVTVSTRALSVGESDAGLRAGERVRVRALLEAMLVKSANEAAFALAEHTAGTGASFVVLMNETANRLGLENTHFTNPHGLDDPAHHTTASDLAALTRYAMRLPEFRRIVRLRESRLGGDRTLETTNRLLDTYPGADGVKTGWTDDAGYCLVGSATRGDRQLVAVILGARNEATRFEQARRLLDWGFAHYQTRELVSAGETLGVTPVSDYLDRQVVGVAAEGTSAAVFDLTGTVGRRVMMPDTIAAPVRQGQRLGMLTIAQGDRLIAQVPIVAAAEVPVPTFMERVRIGLERLWLRLASIAASAAR